MRRSAFVTVGAAALMVAACISYQAATPAPTEPPTAAPTVPPTLAPTAPPTEPPTAGPPTPTPDPDATPRPTAVDIAPYLTSEVTVLNLGDATLALTVSLVDADSPDEFTIGRFELEPNQVTTQAVIPALFRLDFGYSGVDDAGSCLITIEDGEQLQFAVIADGIVMSSNALEPEDPAEMLVATALRCQGDPDS